MKVRLFHDYEPDGSIKPIWLGIDFEGGVPWTQKSIKVDVSNYELQDIYDFEDHIIGCSIELGELMASYLGDTYLGFNLEAIQERLMVQGMDPMKIERFIMLVSDVTEVLATNQFL